MLRRFDAVLEPTKQAVLDMKAYLDEAGVVDQDAALRSAAGHAFYNTSKFTLRDLRARASQQQLKADFEAYRDGFSPNVQDILDSFDLGLPYADRRLDVRNILRFIRERGPDIGRRDQNLQLAVLNFPFFRNKAAYLIGKLA